MNTVEELKKAIDNKSVTAYEVASKIGVNPSVVSRIVSGETKKPNPQTIEKLANYLHSKGNAKYKANFNEVSVPLVSQYAYGGFLSGYADMDYLDSLPVISFEPTHDPKGNYVAFEVRGDSMDDDSKRSIEHGDVVICREVVQSHWVNKLHFKKWDAFVIAHKEDGIIIKSIIDHNIDNGDIIVHSFNPSPEYPDRTINLRDIAKIYSVVESRKKRKV